MKEGTNQNAFEESGDEHWIPLSDLMTSLMMVFMLIAISFMLEVTEKSKQIADQAARVSAIADLYSRTRQEIYKRLLEEFSSDLPKWDAEISENLAIKFNEPDVLFITGSSTINDRFKQILDDFFPRYIKILEEPQFKRSISEIRMEGHTSSLWNKTTVGVEAYLLNMELSQARTRNVLEYILQMNKWNNETETWLIGNVTANGLSSSKRIVGPNGAEDQLRSQRVEFVVRTDAESRIDEILSSSAK
jgi:outer membrane protein OmpA-like peptidoglycan-associated protein